MTRPYELFVDSGDRDEPGSRYFASLEAAFRACYLMPAKWRRFAWIREHRDGGARVTHMRDGRQVPAS
jgi:hypothetical protein